MNAPADAFTLPHSIEAEQAVLGGLLLDNGAIDRIGQLQSRHFYREDHRAIFAQIMQCISKGQPADVISIWDGLQNRGGAFVEGLLPYLNLIAQSTPSAANVARYADIVVEKALLRGLLHVTGKAAELAQNPRGQTADQVLDQVQSMVSKLAERRARTEPKMISELLTEFINETDRRSQGLEAAIPTGIHSLDQMFNGGLRGGQLVIVAGRPSQGKTALSVDIGLNMATTYSVLMFSMEMSGQELVGRALANRGQIHLSRLLNHIDAGDTLAWDSVTRGCSALEPMRFSIDETPAIALIELRMKAKAWKRKHGLDVIIVDYIGLMTGGDGEKRHEQIGSYSRGLKALAKELDVAIIALAQLNRKPEDRGDRKPILSDLRDSGEIEQDADIVVFVHRPEMHEPNNPQLHGYADVLIRKQRNGPLADLGLRFDGPTCSFSEWIGPKPTSQATHIERRKGFGG
ncbi:replicative DNA helicase [Noviherbaspirillum malthae]|uniref:replicative DNA helicase n=1 Tax=Noviherbaspirillum malthae TaxID=1260987 RepID=UPI00188E8115|nr:replicative DNA helicase [Noviherbaspirillum malthae]